MADAIGTGREVEVLVDDTASGPPADGTDPFSTGRADLGMMCAPPYLDLRARRDGGPVELLGVSPVFDDPRAAGRPVYFADVVVRSDDPRWSDPNGPPDLTDRILGVNDRRSLSGALAWTLTFGPALGRRVAAIVETGSHDQSLEDLRTSRIDVASIDSNTLRLRRAAGVVDDSWCRVVHSFGPFPIQPVVVRRSVDADLRAGAREALSTAVRSPELATRLAACGCVGFAPVSDVDFVGLARLLAPR